MSTSSASYFFCSLPCSSTEYSVSQLLGRCQELLTFGTMLVENQDQSTVEPMQQKVGCKPGVAYPEPARLDTSLDESCQHLSQPPHRLRFADRARVEQKALQLVLLEVEIGGLLEEPIQPLHKV